LKDVDPNLRQFHKARVLGAGYGAGGAKYKLIAKLMAGLDLDAKTAMQEIKDFRKTNPKIVGFWNELDVGLKRAARKGEDYIYTLPSGREINYFNCCIDDKGVAASTCIDDSRRTRFWGSKLTENVTQAMARDVFAHGVLDICNKGIDVIWHVHDEVICEVDESDAEEGLNEVNESLTKCPEWCEGLPLASEGGITTRYEK
jgi:DNA polymerase